MIYNTLRKRTKSKKGSLFEKLKRGAKTCFRKKKGAKGIFQTNFLKDYQYSKKKVQVLIKKNI